MAKSKRLIVFPSESQTISNISAEFAVTESAAMLTVKGMKDGDELLIEFEMGDECDPVWVPLVDCCGQVKLTYPRTFIMLPLPMKYRAVLTDVDGNYMVDPSHFEDLLIQAENIKDRPDLVEFYHGCCDEDKFLCDSIKRLPLGDSITGSNGCSLSCGDIGELPIGPDYTPDATPCSICADLV